jgi:hypothetical protein
MTVTAKTSRIYGRPIPSRLKSITFRHGTKPTIGWTMTGRDGCVVDLTQYTVDDLGTIPTYLRVLENTFLGFDPDFIGIVINPQAGQVEFTVDTRKLGGPGIYVAEAAILDADLETVVLSNEFNVIVERGLFGGDPTGMPTLAEIRLRLRDAPETNELLGDFAWDDAEIAQALQEPIDRWNAALPDTGIYYTTQNFPAQYRHWWIRGTIAALFRIAAEWQRRNQFDYAAGGVEVQDLHRSQEYLQAAEQTWAEFDAWARSRKAADNIEQCWGATGGYYREWI